MTPATFTSNLAAFELDLARAVDHGLTAAAATYQTAVQTRLRQGYTTGAFTTGKAADNVIISDPVTEHGVRVIRIGTTWARALEWEVGFLNAWTDRFERVPIWQPIAAQQSARIAATFVATVRADMAKWRAT